MRALRQILGQLLHFCPGFSCSSLACEPSGEQVVMGKHRHKMLLFLFFLFLSTARKVNTRLSKLQSCIQSCIPSCIHDLSQQPCNSQALIFPFQENADFLEWCHPDEGVFTGLILSIIEKTGWKMTSNFMYMVVVQLKMALRKRHEQCLLWESAGLWREICYTGSP